jgi:hypothetical protein
MGDTRYDADRAAQNGIVFYKEDHSRITGEEYCLHLEWRLNRLRAVRAAGIETGQDLLKFDHRAFWQKRLRLYEVDEGPDGERPTDDLPSPRKSARGGSSKSRPL